MKRGDDRDKTGDSSSPDNKRPREADPVNPDEETAGPSNRGRGGRGGRGRRVVTEEERNRQRLERHDVVTYRHQPSGPNADPFTKKVRGGNRTALLANFFVLSKRTDWCIYNYRVDFSDPEIETREKKKLLRVHARTLGAYIFDGSNLYVSHRIVPEPLVLASCRETNQAVVELSIRLVAELSPTDVMYLQFYNIIVRKCLDAMSLEEIGRHYYDRHAAIRLEAHKLELWPGFITSMRNHERDIMLGVEATHKVLRTDTCLHVMARLDGSHNMQKAVNEELIGSIVMTHYNRKTYRVDDIDWETTPRSTFDLKGEQVSFADYFESRYKLRVSDLNQPMLVSRPKKRDFHRGNAGPILLVPEFCQMTGLNDEMRADFRLMRAVTGHLHIAPQARVEVVRSFMSRLQAAPGITEELDQWGLQFQNDLVRVDGRIIEREHILFGNGNVERPNDKGDWGSAFRNNPMIANVPLTDWVVITPGRDAQVIENLISNMHRVAGPLRFNMYRPIEIIRLNDIRIPTYISAIHQAMANHRGKIQLIFIVLPKQVTDIYAAVKKLCCIEYGIASQCFIVKSATNPRGLMSICTKVVVQMNAKLGGEPWHLQVPLEKLMIVGFDVYHCGKRRGASVGAMVATTNANQAKYFSTVSFHNSKEEMSTNLCVDITKCLYAYQKVNKDLPRRIIMYRDGVGEGQLTFVYNTELEQLRTSMQNIYRSAGAPPPKFTFIVVSKKINTRLFACNQYGRIDNPEPGTVVDDIVTLPERYDFFLVSQSVRQGTASPTSYNVLFDKSGIIPERMQRLTFKLCHYYFNWSGTVTVPAPCQYAHKLAHLTGIALQGTNSNPRLSHVLHFL